MLEVGWSEILVIALILIIVVGPKDLPQMLRTFGRMATRLRGMANEFKGQFDEALREADMDDVRKGLGEVSKLNPANSLRDAINPIRQLGQDIKADLKKASEMPSLSSATTAAAEPATPSSDALPADAVTDTTAGDVMPDTTSSLQSPRPALDPLPVAATPAAPISAPAAPPILPAGIAPVVPETPVANPAVVSNQAAVSNPSATPAPAADAAAVPAATKAPRRKASAPVSVSEAALDAAPAEPKTRKAPVRLKDAALAAVAAEAVAKKRSNRRKPAAADGGPDKPKKTQAVGKAEEAGDA